MAYNNAANLSSSGVQVINSSGGTFGRTITGSGGVTVTNGDGTGGNPTVSASGGGGSVVLIQSQAAAGLSAVNFTTNISTYPQILAVWNGISNTSGGSAWSMAFSNDGGSTWTIGTTGAECTHLRCPYNSTTFAATGRDDYQLLSSVFSTGVNLSANGYMYIYNCGLSSPAWTIGKGTSPVSTVSNGIFSGYSGISTVNALQFIFSAPQVIVGGTVSLYGIKTS